MRHLKEMLGMIYVYDTAYFSYACYASACRCGPQLDIGSHLIITYFLVCIHAVNSSKCMFHETSRTIYTVYILYIYRERERERVDN